MFLKLFFLLQVNLLYTFQTFSILVPKKENLLVYLNSRGIGATVHFTPALHQQKLYKYKKNNTSLNNAEMISARIVSLPLYPNMKDKDIIYVSNNLKNFLISFEYIFEYNLLTYFLFAFNLFCF